MDDYICDDPTCDICMSYKTRDTQVNYWEYLKDMAMPYGGGLIGDPWEDTHEFISKL